MDTYRVSTSEVATYLTCAQRWMYAHHPSYHLEPRTLGVALSRGLMGHKALEIYYQAILDGKLESEARQLIQSYIMTQSLNAMKVGDISKSQMVAALGVILMEYVEESTPILLKQYNIVGVEQVLVASLTKEIYFAGRVDLALEEKHGAYRGYIVPFDHKFTYNFWPEASLRINAQISNYVWAYRENGEKSRRGIINMIRYRDNAQERYKQESVPTNDSLRNKLIQNHVIAAQRIVELKKKPTVDVSDGVTRSVSKFNCEYCPFSNLCYTEACGDDASTMIQANFRPNSYGYDDILDIE
jgi:hypothetical protein